MSKYKGIIFDIDGTLLNTFDMNFYPLLKIIKEELNKEMCIDDVKQYAAYPGLKILELLGINQEVYPRWVQYVNEYPTGATLFEGIEAFFENVTEDIKLGVVSSKTRAQYKIDFTPTGLDTFMCATILADDTDIHKPDPTPILLCCKKMRLKPEEVIYIGDALNDKLASDHAGCDFGYAKYGNTSKEDVEATYTFESPSDLLTLLK